MVIRIFVALNDSEKSMFGLEVVLNNILNIGDNLKVFHVYSSSENDELRNYAASFVLMKVNFN
jgi:hypothetical protein